MENVKTKILLVEDDPSLGPLLQEYLDAKGFETKLAEDGQKGSEFFFKGTYDLLLLDVMMPIKDGLSLAKDIRLSDKHTPIIFLTAKSMKEDTIDGFNAGADDYITKPFSMEELLARVNAVLRRSSKSRSTDSDEVNFKVGNYNFNSEKQLLQIGVNEQKLTTKESQLLRLLCVHKNDVLDRSFALKSIWQDDNYFNGRSMDVYIAKLRKYLRDDSKVEIINIHGKGFKLLVNN
ncbi:MAG: response regulator transcription factor [Sphingobacteriaceae bacterium]|jgi:DNA-binding response OmpR family regulator|nr:response regulator transcription factor [Sphingobacteriaceae bacterium]MBK7312207.1 response regulator transcription factor [Sphingobacteriaceae bacterium]MBK7816919.1 response regulator transcription factor [Sphingobacteriaceae bacterium]